ncbi:MAG: amino acid aminotransferase [Burkholderiales bacterium]
MLEALRKAEPDRILSLIALVRDDPRPGKMDLSIGVYRDESGRTPILAAVRAAERRLYEGETTKSYVGPAGDAAFNAAVQRLVFGDGDASRIRAVQTPGGAGALRILAGLLARARPGATVWLPDPTWVNHESIMADAGLAIRRYPYFDPATGGIRFDALLDALGGAAAGDAVLLHGCCHNPSGADPTAAEWRELADLLVRKGLFPFVDLAYQGFGDGLDEDAAAVRLLAGRVPEMAVATSCSKNFGIYRERTGAAFVLGATPAQADVALSQLVVCARIAYSMPPDHGASIVRIVLEDPALAARWRDELAAMRGAVVATRRALAAAFRTRTGTERYDFLLRHRGMFSLLGVDERQADRLRREHGIYVVADGRANLAGLRANQIEPLVSALLAVRG